MLANLDSIIEEMIKAAWADPSLRDSLIRHIKDQNIELLENWEALLPPIGNTKNSDSVTNEFLSKAIKFKDDLLQLLTTANEREE